MDTPLFVGVSASAQLLASDVDLAGRCRASVLITGPDGRDRSAVARLLHAKASSDPQAFVAVACDRGIAGPLAFQPSGFPPAARTIYLDDLHGLSGRDQDRLLRFLEERGGDAAMRVMAGSDGRLAERVGAGSFREDLFYRLNVIHIAIPALRDRRDDVGAMFRHCLQAIGERAGLAVPALTPDAVAALETYDWPGNVAELRSIAEQLMASRVSTVTRAALPPQILQPAELPRAAIDPPGAGTRDQVIVRIVEELRNVEDGLAPRATRAR